MWQLGPIFSPKKTPKPNFVPLAPSISLLATSWKSSKNKKQKKKLERAL
jgi:hypothetical protein